MLNSAAAGRRLALRVVAFQALATLLTAGACLTIGSRAALAALAGGGAMTLGSLAAAWGAFGGGVAGAGVALGRLLLIVERYPELRSNENFLRLQDELAGTENRIAIERQRYNDSVTTYNVRIRSFPTLLFANLLGFREKPLFEVAEGAEAVPRVDFNTGGQGG